jgi:CDK-activating kinase assembly factor MAT1
MKFLINPVCYHKMCDSCVDRLWGHGGPAPCPIRGCGKTLRRLKFRAPTFDDMQLEREMDIRKDLANVFNRREDEFESNRTYNDYLNDVEDITFKLINNIEVEQTKKKLEAYKQENLDSISRNKKIDRVYTEQQKQRLQDQQRQSELSRLAAFNEAQEERKERVNARKDIINRLANETGDATAIARQGEKVLKGVAERKKAFASEPTDTFTIRGLKQIVKAEPEAPYDPFGDIGDIKDFVVVPTQTNIWNDYLGKIRKEKQYKAGGYSLDEFYARAMTEAFGGLGISISQEKATRKPKVKIEPDTKSNDIF